MKKSSIQDQAELCSSIGSEMAAKNRDECHGSYTKISDFAIYWVSFRLMFMSISLFMVNFYQSNNKTSSNTFEFTPNATDER